MRNAPKGVSKFISLSHAKRQAKLGNLRLSKCGSYAFIVRLTDQQIEAMNNYLLSERQTDKDYRENVHAHSVERHQMRHTPLMGGEGGFVRLMTRPTKRGPGLCRCVQP